MRTACAAALVLAAVSDPAAAESFDVGPGQDLQEAGDVPWESLAAGDEVRIHWRAEPYRAKWVVVVEGTEQAPFVIRGVPGPAGELPVIDGRDATTRAGLDFWNEDRGVIKIGGSSNPPDETPTWIVIENLEIRSGRPPYQFTGGDGLSAYRENSASVFIEKGEHIVLRNCVLHDSGNGLFASHAARGILVEGCWIHDNGIEGSIYEHNNYTEAFGIVFQYNLFGPLRDGCPGNNLKDRSAGTVIRYNWIEGGNRQLDLVDSDYATFYGDPLYRTTYVYGNVLIEPDGAGNSQIVHYGGDSGDTARYRKGILHFYHNTVVSTRAGNTTLFRLSTNEEGCDCRNNIVYVAADGQQLAMLDGAGTLTLRNDWFKTGWRDCHGDLTGSVQDLGGILDGQDPGFNDENGGDYQLADGSGCIDAGTDLHAGVLPDHAVLRQYVPHQGSEPRPVDAAADLGAFEASEADTTSPRAPAGLTVTAP